MKKITLLVFVFINQGLFSQTTCSTALPVTEGTFTAPAISGNTAITNICTGSGSATMSVWYSFTPTETSLYTISTDLPVNTGKDTRLHVYSGTCDQLICIGGDNDSGSGYLSIAQVNLEANQTYYIVFDNRWSSDGFDFSIEGTDSSFTNYVNFTQVNLENTLSYQIGAIDMNQDGLDDIVQINNTTLQIRYQTPGDLNFNTIESHTVNIDHPPIWSLAGGDLNKDGRIDLVSGGGQGATLILSDPSGTSYTTQSPSAYIFSQRTNMIDLNNDGELDVFICHDVAPNTYLINNGDDEYTFYQGGIGDHPLGGNYGSIWVDYNNDNLPDLFIAKCRGGVNTTKLNQLFRNNGDGTYTEVSVEANMNHPNQTWSAAWGDYDNDGYMDAFVGVSSLADGGHLMMRNNGDGTFTDIFETTGLLNHQNLNHEFIAVDINNDGWIDIITGENGIYYNNGDGSFTSMISPANAGSLADLNNDGFIDVFNGNKIFYNQGNTNNWIKINLVGVDSNKNGIGARIEIYPANENATWNKQIRDVRSGEGFKYMSTLTTHFGLGQENAIDRIVIHWPSGLTEMVENPDINTLHTFVEGTLLNNHEVTSKSFKLYPNPANDFINIEAISNSQTDFEYEVYNLLGSKVLNGKTSGQIDISHLANGTYILQIQQDNQKQSLKFLKK